MRISVTDMSVVFHGFPDVDLPSEPDNALVGFTAHIDKCEVRGMRLLIKDGTDKCFLRAPVQAYSPARKPGQKRYIIYRPLVTFEPTLYDKILVEAVKAFKDFTKTVKTMDVGGKKLRYSMRP